MHLPKSVIILQNILPEKWQYYSYTNSLGQTFFEQRPGLGDSKKLLAIYSAPKQKTFSIKSVEINQINLE